jgi:hypothetical protein
MADKPRTAHYFEYRQNNQVTRELIISKSFSPRDMIEKHTVDNERSARQLARDLGAKPWNF